jgi:hypothetical protein
MKAFVSAAFFKRGGMKMSIRLSSSLAAMFSIIVFIVRIAFFAN